MSRLEVLLALKPGSLDYMLDVLHSSLDIGPHDVKLLGDIDYKVSAVHRELGLDPADTTDTELVRSLRGRMHTDNTLLAKKLGISDANNQYVATPIIQKWATDYFKDRSCYVVKSPSLKKIITECPPKRLMKLLRCRSVVSMVKQHSVRYIVAVARYVEDDRWLTNYHDLLQALETSDFEIRNVEVIENKSRDVSVQLARTLHRHHNILHSKEAGAIVLAPTGSAPIQGYTIRTISLLIHYIQEIRYVSSLAKTLAPTHSFGEEYIRILIHRHDAHGQLANKHFHWRAMHHAINRAQIQDILPPHITEDDLHIDDANNHIDRLLERDETMWSGLSHVLVAPVEGVHVSLNIIDLAIAGNGDSADTPRSLKYARRHLEQELLSRYLREPRVRQVILKRFGI